MAEAGSRDSPFLGPAELSLLLLSEDVDATYRAMTRSAAAAVGAQTCHLALYDAESDEVVAQRPRYAAPGQASPQYRFPPSPASAHVVRTGQPYICNDTGADALYPPTAREEGVRSVLTVPVRAGDRVVGLLYALNKPGGFTPSDAHTLMALGAAAAVTLENLRLYQQERERRLLNEGLRELSRALVTTQSEDSALGTVLDQVWRVVRYEAAVALVMESNLLRVAAVRGGEQGREIPLEEAGELADVLTDRQPRLIERPAPLLMRLGLGYFHGPALAAPLQARGQPLGAFVMVFERDYPLSLRQAQLVGAMADHAALFLEAGAVLQRERLLRARATAVARLTRLANTKRDPEELLQAAAPDFLALSGADRAIVYVAHPRNPVLIPVADAGIPQEEEEAAHVFRLGVEASGPLAPMLENLQAVAVHGAECEGLTPFADVHTLLVVPLAAHGQLMGAVALATTGHRQARDPALLEFLDGLGQQLALGIENARLFEQLAQMASTDDLTELANRRRFTEALRTELARTRREASPLALLLVDIDHLKRINDTHGHPAGDAAIRHVAAMLKKARRETDLAARLGGEEFAILLPATDLAGAITVAESIRSRLSATQGASNSFSLTVSIGVSSSPEDGLEEEELIRMADRRLYAAKSSGRNKVFSIHNQTAAAEEPSGTNPR
jgi:diguanylate cyclase (GGDEF)-like protein